MATLEDELYEDAAYEAEGAAELYGDEMEDLFSEGDFGDEFQESDEWEAMDSLANDPGNEERSLWSQFQ